MPIFLWVIITPFGDPVVPDENGNNIMSLSGRQFINENSIAIVGSVLSTWPKRITPKGS